MDPKRFQVHLGGIIALLSNNLYSGPAVVIRELLQNAVDAIHARQLIEKDFNEPQIEFSLVEAKGTPPTLMVEDNGVGLTESEVHRFLATIGESSKRDDLGAAREDFIGQFGIGLLSCFMLADEIVLVTRSAKPGNPAVEWRGKPDGTYTVKILNTDGLPGTRVFLRCKKGAEDFFQSAELRRLINHYGGILHFPIHLSAKGARARINDREPPWRQKSPSRGDLLEYAAEILEESFFDAIPLRSKTGGVDGVACILPHAHNPAARQSHRLYLKNMLVSREAQNLLPDWAFFVRCILNANKLRPTASRESFYEDDSLEAAREELGDCIRRWILQTQRQEPQRMGRFIAIHGLAIKNLAIHDDEIYRLFIDVLPFETSRGVMTLAEYRGDNPGIHYAATVDQFRQLAPVAGAQNLCIINAGYTYDRDLLERYAEFFPDTPVERVDSESLAQSFEDLDLDEHEACFELLRAADKVLRPARCETLIKRFKPASLVALYSISDSGLLHRSARGAAEQSDEHWAGLLKGAIGDAGSAPYSRLCFNYSNPLIQRLTQVKDKSLLRRLIELIYVHALMAGHHPMTAHELKLLNEGLMDLITLAADNSTEK